MVLLHFDRRLGEEGLAILALTNQREVARVLGLFLGCFRLDLGLGRSASVLNELGDRTILLHWRNARPRPVYIVESGGGDCELELWIKPEGGLGFPFHNFIPH